MDEITTWLMEGDAAIRWQTMRSLLDAPEPDWQAERQRTVQEGWGARFLAFQDANGRWGAKNLVHQSSDGYWGGGIYSPKWTSTTYTLLTLCSIGIPPDYAPARRGAEEVVTSLLGETCTAAFNKHLAACDRCVVGMMLRFGAYFKLDSERIEAMVDNLLNETMPDGAWNCRKGRRPKPEHSSFHTTFNVLEGLREYIEAGNGKQHAAALAAEQAALEWALQHRLFKSHRTGQAIDPKFTLLSFPPQWHYDVLRGLTYFARANAPRDERLQDAVDLLCDRRRKDGTWPVQHKHSGKVFFDMEKTGGPSRWNTLRAMQVLQWWEGQA
jgi:hypothetical protein